tara:strand:+ start:734 stop:985 length:252 start_codon:yes stop_codon:yes gene_type:complete
MGIFSYESESSQIREAKNITFDVPDDMNIHEYKIMCVRLAHAMGYQNNSINSAFGELEYETESDKDFKKFIKSITELTGSFAQ